VPLVSVVVICYNDARHLATAVRSALRQTLRDLEIVVVDDGSTDETPAVVLALASEDPRVVPVRLDGNSGGCSRPRNAGLGRATGDYVTFLDSDDVLTRRACARLVAAARRHDADLVCGRWVRHHHAPTRFVAAHVDLYRRPAVAAGITERPEQLYDTPAPAKLYRRRMLLDEQIEFPEGLLYEDLLFTTEAYLAARTIAVVPDLVYVWNVRRDAEVPSITNRADLRRWQDRFEVHRRIDAFLSRHRAGASLTTVKTTKFLTADLALLLRELRRRGADDRRALVDLAGQYTARLASVDLCAGPPASRVAAVLAARGDVEGVLDAADFSATGGIGVDLVPRAGRLWWPAPATVDEPALDVTDTGLLTAGFARTPFLVTVQEAGWDATSLRLQGRVADICDRLGPAAGLSARLTVSGRVGGPLWTGNPVCLDDAPGGVTFAADVDLAAVGRRLARPTVGHELRLGLALSRGGEAVHRPLTARDARLPADDHGLPTPWRWLVGDRVRLAENNGRLVLGLDALPAAVDRTIAAASWARYVLRQGTARLAGR